MNSTNVNEQVDGYHKMKQHCTSTVNDASSTVRDTTSNTANGMEVSKVAKTSVGGSATCQQPEINGYQDSMSALNVKKSSKQNHNHLSTDNVNVLTSQGTLK